MFPMHDDDREVDDLKARFFKYLPKQPQDIVKQFIFLNLIYNLLGGNDSIFSYYAYWFFDAYILDFTNMVSCIWRRLY